MHGYSSAGATARGLAHSKVGVHVNLNAYGFGLPRIVIDQPRVSDEVSDQSLSFVVGSLVGNGELSTQLFAAVSDVNPILSQIIGSG